MRLLFARSSRFSDSAVYGIKKGLSTTNHDAWRGYEAWNSSLCVSGGFVCEASSDNHFQRRRGPPTFFGGKAHNKILLKLLPLIENGCSRYPQGLCPSCCRSPVGCLRSEDVRSEEGAFESRSFMSVNRLFSRFRLGFFFVGGGLTVSFFRLLLMSSIKPRRLIRRSPLRPNCVKSIWIFTETLVSWRTLTPVRRRRLNVSSTTLENRTRLVKSTKEEQPWIGWHRNKSVVLQLPPLPPRVNGRITESISLIPPVTSTSPWKLSVLFVFWMVRLPFLMVSILMLAILSVQ